MLLNKSILAIGIVFLFIVSSVAPIVFGTSTRISNKETQQSTISDDGGLMNSSWPMFRHDLLHSGYTVSKAPNSNNIYWNFATDGAIASSPSVVDGKVYFGSHDKWLYCLDSTYW
jgi:outer membrane protein assembly factor BamB